MFETNTASCGGFPGISNTYGAALWGIDYGFQMAYGNFTHGMFHTGGENVYYNVSVFFLGLREIRSFLIFLFFGFLVFF